MAEVWRYAYLVIVVAILAMLVRPGSKSGAALIAMMNAFAGIVTEATGGNKENTG